MPISSVSLMAPTQIVNGTSNASSTIISSEAQQSFADNLKKAIANVNEQQIASDTLTEKMINGGDVELHEVMVASQKASITLNATMEVRNKVVEAYQEVMRMSI